MIRLMLVQWRKSIFFVTDSTTTLCMYLCTTTTTFSKNLYFDKSKKHIQQTELSKSSCKFKQEVMLIVHLLLKSVCRHVWSRIGKKKICSAFLDRHIVNVLCYYFYNIFWSLKQELQRIQQQRTWKDLVTYVVKYIDRLLIWGCKFFFYGRFS